MTTDTSVTPAKKLTGTALTTPDPPSPPAPPATAPLAAVPPRTI